MSRRCSARCRRSAEKKRGPPGERSSTYSTIPAESKVLMLTGSAGRDDRVFPDPDRFDVRRSFNHHVSFGYGIHFCVGAALARMEGKIALEETLKRYPTWDVDPAHVVRQHTSTVRGYSEVGIVVS